MLQNLKTKSKLSLLSLIALLGIIILGSLGIIQLKEVNNGLERVYNDRVVPLEQLKIIADEYAVNIVDTTHQTRNKNFQFDKCISNIDNAEMISTAVAREVFEETGRRGEETFQIRDCIRRDWNRCRSCSSNLWNLSFLYTGLSG